MLWHLSKCAVCGLPFFPFTRPGHLHSVHQPSRLQHNPCSAASDLRVPNHEREPHEDEARTKMRAARRDWEPHEDR
jgi:hypothetical protein